MRRSALQSVWVQRTRLVMVWSLVTLGVVAQKASAHSSLRDLLVGLAVGMSGAAVVGRSPVDFVGWSLMVACVLWSLGTLAGAPGALGDVGAQLQFAHRGALLVAFLGPSWTALRIWMPVQMSMWRRVATVVVAVSLRC